MHKMHNLILCFRTRNGAKMISFNLIEKNKFKYLLVKLIKIEGKVQGNGICKTLQSELTLYGIENLLYFTMNKFNTRQKYCTYN